MARLLIIKSLSFCVLVLLVLSSILSPTQARPFNVLIKSPQYNAVSGGIQSILDGLSLGSIKDSGPSPPGEGHHPFTKSGTLGGVKDSGPSPGQGHKVVTGTHH